MVVRNITQRLIFETIKGEQVIMEKAVKKNP